MRNFSSLLFGFIFIALATSCASVYKPSVHHTHLLKEKGELHLAGYLGINGIDGQIAYAVSDHLGIAADASYGNTNIQDSQTSQNTADTFHKHAYAEGAFSYFDSFADRWHYEVLAGVGFGTATGLEEYDWWNGGSQAKASGNYSKYYLQCNIGISHKDKIEGGIALRVAQVEFNGYESLSLNPEEPTTTFYHEPAFFVRFGGEKVKIQTNVGLSFPFIDTAPSYSFSFPLMLSFGIHANLSTRKKD